MGDLDIQFKSFFSLKKGMIKMETAMELQPVEYEGIRVLTTQQLAESYETTNKVISNNFNNNKNYYQIGKHYFLLQGKEFKDFLQSSNLGTQISSKARSTYLWTERGAFLHAKSLNSSKAWELYDKLVDFYFESKKHNLIENKQTVNQVETINPQMLNMLNQLSNSLNSVTNTAERMVNMMERMEKRLFNERRSDKKTSRNKYVEKSFENKKSKIETKSGSNEDAVAKNSKRKDNKNTKKELSESEQFKHDINLKLREIYLLTRHSYNDILNNLYTTLFKKYNIDLKREKSAYIKDHKLDGNLSTLNYIILGGSKGLKDVCLTELNETINRYNPKMDISLASVMRNFDNLAKIYEDNTPSKIPTYKAVYKQIQNNLGIDWVKYERMYKDKHDISQTTALSRIFMIQHDEAMLEEFDKAVNELIDKVDD